MVAYVCGGRPEDLAREQREAQEEEEEAELVGLLRGPTPPVRLPTPADLPRGMKWDGVKAVYKTKKELNQDAQEVCRLIYIYDVYIMCACICT